MNIRTRYSKLVYVQAEKELQKKQCTLTLLTLPIVIDPNEETNKIMA